jgi:hypothetical protein
MKHHPANLRDTQFGQGSTTRRKSKSSPLVTCSTFSNRKQETLKNFFSIHPLSSSLKLTKPKNNISNPLPIRPSMYINHTKSTINPRKHDESKKGNHLPKLNISLIGYRENHKGPNRVALSSPALGPWPISLGVASLP